MRARKKRKESRELLRISPISRERSARKSRTYETTYAHARFTPGANTRHILLVNTTRERALSLFSPGAAAEEDLTSFRSNHRIFRHIVSSPLRRPRCPTMHRRSKRRAARFINGSSTRTCARARVLRRRRCIPSLVPV